MIGFNRALAEVLKHAKVLPAVKIPVEESVGRILAEDIYSSINMPPFDKSAVDGYALNHLDTVPPVKLKCIYTLPAGCNFRGQIRRGECVKIMTGAPIPQGATAVVMTENTQSSNNYVKIFGAVRKGRNICRKGEDITAGQKIKSKKTKVFVSDIALFAGIGRRFIKAVPAPTAAFLNSGDEIVSGGRKLPKNKIYNSNGPQLAAWLDADGITDTSLGIIKDNLKCLAAAVRKGLNHNILLISGAVSMGDYDFIPAALEKAGVRKIFHNVKIKPGKPLFFGKHRNTLVFGIPGNPVANFTTYLLFIQPALRKMMGYQNYMPQFKEGILEKDFTHNPGRRHFVPVKLSNKEKGYSVLPVNSSGSADIVSLSNADGFMMIDADKTQVKKNGRVKFISWK